MRLPITCRDCEYYSKTYGCIDHDCEVYRDIKAEADYEDWKDKKKGELIYEEY